MPRTILATGGAGYVGSHVVAALLAAGNRVTILDDLSGAIPDATHRIEALGHGTPGLVVGDIRDEARLDFLFRNSCFDAVVHLAGLKSVGESLAEPQLYFDVNVGGTTALLRAMRQHGVRSLVFSSSATVYGTPTANPVPEAAPIGPLTPYGRTKAMAETALSDAVAADPEMAAISLRYFNPVGAHPSGLIGETPRGIPNNLFPYIAETAAGLRDTVQVFGGDYPTRDGTGVRDFVHVVDLAAGHVAALEVLLSRREARGRHLAVNLGCGQGHTVLEAIAAFGRAAGRNIPYEVVARRSGDVAECVADATLAADLLGWRAQLGLDAMCRDHWAFQNRQMATAQAGKSSGAPWARASTNADAAP